MKDLEANEELLISYVDPISTSIEKKTELKEKYNFACRFAILRLSGDSGENFSFEQLHICTWRFALVSYAVCT